MDVERQPRTAASTRCTLDPRSETLDPFRPSPPRQAVLVDDDHPARRRAQLRAMHDAAEVIRDVPVFGVRSGLDGRAALHVLAHDLSAAPDVRANRAAGDGAADGRDVASAAATDLVAEHATDDGARNCAGNVP